MSTKPLLEKKQAIANSPQSFASSAWAYFRLTRLHKFPAGSDLIFWPSGEHVCPSANLRFTSLCPQHGA